MSRHHRQTSDAMLLEAIRRKALRDIAERASAGGNSVTNNVYGGGGHHAGGGVLDHMAGEAGGDPADRDYFVDIERNDHPEGGGWSKKVHRYTKKKS